MHHGDDGTLRLSQTRGSCQFGAQVLQRDAEPADLGFVGIKQAGDNELRRFSWNGKSDADESAGIVGIVHRRINTNEPYYRSRASDRRSPHVSTGNG